MLSILRSSSSDSSSPSSFLQPVSIRSVRAVVNMYNEKANKGDGENGWQPIVVQSVYKVDNNTVLVCLNSKTPEDALQRLLNSALMLAEPAFSIVNEMEYVEIVLVGSRYKSKMIQALQYTVNSALQTMHKDDESAAKIVLFIAIAIAVLILLFYIFYWSCYTLYIVLLQPY